MTDIVRHVTVPTVILYPFWFWFPVISWAIGGDIRKATTLDHLHTKKNNCVDNFVCQRSGLRILQICVQQKRTKINNTVVFSSLFLCFFFPSSLLGLLCYFHTLSLSSPQHHPSNSLPLSCMLLWSLPVSPHLPHVLSLLHPRSCTSFSLTGSGSLALVYFLQLAPRFMHSPLHLFLLFPPFLSTLPLSHSSPSHSNPVSHPLPLYFSLSLCGNGLYWSTLKPKRRSGVH